MKKKPTKPIDLRQEWKDDAENEIITLMEEIDELELSIVFRFFIG